MDPSSDMFVQSFYELVYKRFNNIFVSHQFSLRMPPKRKPTVKSSSRDEPRRLSTRIAAKAMPPVTAGASKATRDYEEFIDIDAELTNAEEDSDKEAPRRAGSQAETSGPNAAPSVPSELATTQGRTAYDVR